MKAETKEEAINFAAWRERYAPVDESAKCRAKYHVTPK